jgi:dolichyl-phosphate-mannose-protein mannosyltransferase
MAIVVALYAVGLTREIGRPWNGLHEWNGALYSLFARNFLRYPWEIHHGMPLIAVGEAIPAENERSIYPSHPAGLVWLVAAAFRVFGESEWAARLVPIMASLGSVVLLMLVVRRRWGDEIAIICGLLYSILPMTVYFGRMVNHEPLCLFFMLSAAWAWDQLVNPAASTAGRRCAGVVWISAIIAGAWIDWAGALFAGLFALCIVAQAIRHGRRDDGRSRRLDVPYLSNGWRVLCVASIAFALAGMLIHVGWFGFGRRWNDLAKIFLSRASSPPEEWPERAWSISGGNFTWPGLLLGAAGLAIIVFNRILDRRQVRSSTPIGGASVLLATGVIWLALFWRQYQMHQYWAFYLGPFMALGCGATIQWASGTACKVSRVAAGALRILLIGVLVAFGIRGTHRLFVFESRPPEDIAAWRDVRRVAPPDQRILVFPDSLHFEDWGGTRIRFINPPQFPYYADRLFDSEGDLYRVAALAGSHTLYLVDMKGIGEGLMGLAALCERFPCKRRGNMIWFDLRPTASSPRTAPHAPIE